FSMRESSCLVQKLSHYVNLHEKERSVLSKLERSDQTLPRNSSLYQGGRPLEALYVVKEGWLFASTLLADGRRQITRFFYPGDVVGLTQIPYTHLTHDVETSTDAVICPFPKRHLDEVLVSSPRLGALLWTLAAVEQTTFLDRIRVLGRMRAIERIAYLLLEVESRLAITSALRGPRRFELPVTQTVIADSLGLTNVTVSRTFADMDREGLIRRDGSQFELLRREALVELAEFYDRFATIDTDWFPGPPPSASIEE
ncbi:MAG: helix-turn-helix domain-containing protein, partial [Myxococcota bacterium]